MNPEQALALSQRVVETASARGLVETEATLTHHMRGTTRYARSTIHQSLTTQAATLGIRVVRRGAVGLARTERFTPEGVLEALERAQAAADGAPPDPGWPGLPRLGTGVVDLARDECAGPRHRAAVVAAIVAAARRRGPERQAVEVHGVIECVDSTTAVANSEGLASAATRSTTWVVVLAMADDGGTGYAEQRATSLAEVPAPALGARAAADARRTASTKRAPTHSLPAVLSEYAVADLVAKLARTTLSAARVADGSSSFVAGERLASPLVSLADDHLDPAGLPHPFDAEGVPRRRVDLARTGVAVEVVSDTRTAGRSGSTGHAVGYPDAVGPLPLNPALAPGVGSIDDLVAGVDDGLLVRRFFYSNVADTRRVLVTGSTRDGLFRIRGGEVAEALAGARFRLSYLDLLSHVDAVGAETRAVSGWYGGVHVLGDVTASPVRLHSLQLRP